MSPRAARLAAIAALAAALLAPAAARPAVTLQKVGDFSRPVFVTAPPGDTQRVVVVERRGTVRLLIDGVVQATPFLDISPLVATSDATGEERGLLSLAFAPDYASTGRLYVYYTGNAAAAPGVGDIVVDEYTAAGPASATVDVATRRRVLTVTHPAGNHNGGQLAFGPDGLLWLATGDGGGGGDPDGNGQNRATMLGKMLRVDPRPGAQLAPSDNPFAAGGGHPTVWAYGLRNPFRFSFDRVTGDLAIGDVGQGFVEEIDFVTKASGLGRAANYGWNTLEGRYLFGPGPVLPLATPGQIPAGHVPPVIEKLHGDGWCAITGGYVVRDPALPDLLGRYVYGDFCRGEVRSAVLGAGGAQGDAPTGLTVPQTGSFGEDGCGRLYVTSLAGPVYRLSDTGRCAGPAPVPWPTPPAPGPPPPPAQPTPPLAATSTAARRQRAVRSRVVAVRVGCTLACRVRVTARLTVRLRSGVARLALTPVVRALPAGGAATVRVALPRRARAVAAAALARGRRVTVAVTTVATSAGSPAVTRRSSVTVTG